MDELMVVLRAMHCEGYRFVRAAVVAERLWPNGRTHNANGQVFNLPRQWPRVCSGAALL